MTTFSERPTPKPAQLVIESPHLKIYHGRAEDWQGDEQVDLVFTNPYGPLPRQLAGVPMILHQWVHRSDELAKWVGVDEGDLQLLGKWNRDREAFWCLNMAPFPVKIAQFSPEPGGWYPPWMVDEILGQYWARRQGWTDEAYKARNGRPFTIWDGFMGRGTLARILRARDFRTVFVGVEELGAHIDLAAEYLAPLW